MITGTLARILEEKRSELNQIFYSYKINYSRLNDESFTNIIQTFLHPLVESINSKIEYNEIVKMVNTFYKVLLELLCKDFIGTHSKYPNFWRSLRQLFLAIPDLTALHSQILIPKFINAIYKISVVNHGNIEVWIDTMIRISKQTQDINELLDAGMLASWQSGLAHYRLSVLKKAESLSEEILYSVFNIFPKENYRKIQDAIQILKFDPWMSFENALDPDHKKTGLEIMVIDTFSGYGGRINQAPNISMFNSDFIISIGNTDYKLYSDIYGRVMLRASTEEILSEEPEIIKFESMVCKQNGEVSFKKFSKIFAELNKVSNWESFGSSMVAVVPYSYNIYLVYLK